MGLGISIDRKNWKTKRRGNRLNAKPDMAPVTPGMDVQQLVQQYIKDNKVMVFSKTTCPFCKKVTIFIQYLKIFRINQSPTEMTANSKNSSKHWFRFGGQRLVIGCSICFNYWKETGVFSLCPCQIENRCVYTQVICIKKLTPVCMVSRSPDKKCEPSDVPYSYFTGVGQVLSRIVILTEVVSKSIATDNCLNLCQFFFKMFRSTSWIFQFLLSYCKLS